VREARFLMHSVGGCDGANCKIWNSKTKKCEKCTDPLSLDSSFNLVELEERNKYGVGQFYDVELLGIAKASYLQADINSDEGAASPVRVNQYGFQVPQCV
jgi:hypothetical protein